MSKKGGQAAVAAAASFVKLLVPAGKASAQPPVGPALGAKGVKAMDFAKEFNAKTAHLEVGIPTPAIVKINPDRTFSFEIKSEFRSTASDTLQLLVMTTVLTFSLSRIRLHSTTNVITAETGGRNRNRRRQSWVASSRYHHNEAHLRDCKDQDARCQGCGRGTGKL